MRPEHITVCVCTYRRPLLLARLLDRLVSQRKEGLFTISVAIVDNDPELSARKIVESFSGTKDLQISYKHVQERNMAQLRNTSVQMSRGEYVAFIDDDEYPDDDWLLLLRDALRKYNAAGALGPVIPDFQTKPPEWVLKARLCERTRLPSGTILKWEQTRTGNALVMRELFLDPNNSFDQRFRLGGEDSTFFEKMIAKGKRFVWCDEAAVHEDVPPNRITFDYFMRRSQLIGHIACRYSSCDKTWSENVFTFCKSVFACTALLVVLPIYRLQGYHKLVIARTRSAYHWAVAMTYMGFLNIEQRDL
jgi:succinoglycan biosynthesis protein ExoM